MIADMNFVGLTTLVKREMVRSLKVINQVIWPPIITTVLYVVVIGFSLGGKIAKIQGVSYAEFLIPGLIMLQVIAATYDECSSSVFQGRFLNAIQEVLIAPISPLEFVVGFVFGSVVRAFLMGVFIGFVGVLTVHAVPQNWLLAIFTIFEVSLLFSSLGIIFGLMAEKFDHIAILTTFVITPLTFVGGVFTPATLLPVPLRTLELFNPMFYTIDAFRRSYTGESFLPLSLSLGAIGLLALLGLGIAWRMVAVGYKLRT